MEITLFRRVLVFVLATCLSSTEIAEVCPYNEFCNSSPLKIDKSRPWRSCCMPCSCEYKCMLVGTCCPDYHFPFTPPTFTCRSQSKIFEDILQVPAAPAVLSQGYRVVDKCVESQTWGAYGGNSSQSELRCAHTNDLEDLTFVTGIITKITYLSKHCALCNNDPVFQEWNLELTGTPDNHFLSSVKERQEYIFSTGKIQSVTNIERLLRASRCEFRVIDRCNMTGQWDFYDKALEEKCAKYEMIYYTMGMRSHIRAAKNPFCYLCNMPLGTNVTHNCDNLTYELQKGHRETVVPFSAILLVHDMSDTPTAEPDTEDISCKRDEILDPLLNQCSRLLCPLGTIALWGECKPLFESVDGYVIAVAFKVNVDSNQTKQALQDVNVFNEIIIFFTEKINNATTKCNICAATLYETKDTELILKLNFVAAAECHYLHLVRQYSTSYKISPIPISISSYPHTVNVSGAIQYNSVAMNTIAYQVYGERICWTRLWYKYDMLHCPSIVYNVETLKNITTDLRAKHVLLEEMTELDNGEARICLDQYQDILISTSAGDGQALVKELTLVFLYYVF